MKQTWRVGAVIAVVMSAGTAWAQSSQRVEQVVMRHMKAFNDADLDGAVRDYDAQVVFITEDGVTRGKDRVVEVFAALLGAPPDKRPHLTLKQARFTEVGGYISWVQDEGQPGEIRGADTFVVKGGKIVFQTVTIIPMHRSASK